jgi:rifampicin phosphotransferase
VFDYLTQTAPVQRMQLLGGGKARNLQALVQHGFDVPRWVVIPTGQFRRFIARAGLEAAIADLLAGLRRDNSDSIAAQIEQLVTSAEFDSDTRNAIEAGYVAVGCGAVAVRSSGSDEDGRGLSFAGQHSSFLNVCDLAEVLRAVKRCWASAFSARSLSYRLHHALGFDAIELAVVLQRMVRSEKSGVAFTANPSSGRRDEIVISSVYGLGEALVSGAVDADTLVLDHETGTIRQATTGDKAQAWVPEAERSGFSVRAVEESTRAQLSLSASEVAELHRVARGIEARLEAPQDIEWAFSEGRLWILQSRPITTLRASGAESTAVIWDNANISESYGGITAPMTFSFARHVYHRVYTEYFRLLGVSEEKLKEIDWLQNMLGYHNGRVYYNILHWYKMLRLVPFYRVNRRILELSMGLEEALPDDEAERLHPVVTDSAWQAGVLRAKSAALFAWHFFTIEHSVKRFVRYFYAMHRELDAVEYRGKPAEAIYDRFVTSKREMLREWGRMILLEQTLGLSYGLLDVLTKRWLPAAPARFVYEMVKPAQSIESVQPSERLRALAKTVRASDELVSLIANTPSELLCRTLLEHDGERVQALWASIDAYIRDFGDRGVNELKLEEPDLRQRPDIVFDMLKSVIGQLDSQRPEAADESEAYLRSQLRGWRLWVYRAARLKARRVVAARETVRFCRSRAFGLVRRMLSAIGEDLQRKGLLEHARDIFELKLDELDDWFDGTTDHKEIRDIVLMRRKLRAQNEQLVAPGRFRTRSVASANEYRASGWSTPQDARHTAAEGVLQGIPCSAGVAEGEALLVDKPLNVGGKILVTYRTDPGWCAVLQSASALLIERGSPLTHVAIVARELGVPTIIQVKGLTARIRSGMRLRVDGGQGTIETVARD